MAAIYAAAQPDVTGGMLDTNPELSICPEASQPFPGQPGMQVSAGDGTPIVPTFRLIDAEEGEGRLTLTYRDQAHGLEYRAAFRLHPQTHVITAQAWLTGDAPLRLHWLAAPVFPAPQSSDGMIDVAGRWCGEFQLAPTPWTSGMRARDNRTGPHRP